MTSFVAGLDRRCIPRLECPAVVPRRRFGLMQSDEASREEEIVPVVREETVTKDVGKTYQYAPP